MSARVFAPAKINLSLRVGPPGEDGRHPLDSLVCFTKSCGDRLTFDPADDLALVIEGPFGQGLVSDDDNLVLRAANLLRAHVGISLGTTVTLDKRLPIASGIGGGSADAAAALIGLNRLWKCGLNTDSLGKLGARLGADVPACVSGQSLLMTGTGETIRAIPPLPKLGLVLVNPMIACPTGPVYRRYDQIGCFADTAPKRLPDLTTPSALLDFLRATPNDLEGSAIEIIPQIASVLAAIATSRDVLLSRMSGSGATCFGLYATIAKAQVAANHIKNTLASSAIWVEADQIN
jgi:4-diphosphocytidyl-2-C-methyl-D-erythritol kinase